MTTFDHFIHNGPNGEENQFDYPSINPYIPCTMRMLATLQVVEHSLPYEMGAIIQRTQRFLDETPPGVAESLIGTEMCDQIKRLEGKAYMVGRSYDEPQGVFTSNRIQRLAGFLLSDTLIDLIYTLEARYRPSSAFLCNENTARHVKRLKDANGRFLFEDSLAAGVPARLLGYPLHTDPDAPDSQIMFGDFREGYLIQMRPSIKILRDPFSQKPHVLFWATHKVSGEVNESEALKVLEFTHAPE